MAHVVLHLDATDGSMRHLLAKPVLTEWVRALGVDPDHCRRLTVLADGDGTVEFECYALDEHGRHYAMGCEPVTYMTRRPLTAPIPARVMEVGGRG